jgi:3D (Asp-Asp-Asp) domain-containing protein
VFIPGFGIRVVEDRTAKRFDGRWDMFVKDHTKAMKYGKKKVRVYEVTKRN